MAIITCVILSACTDKKAQEEAVLNDVIKIHDKVMASDDRLMKNKMQLDTLLKQGKLTSKDSAKMLSDKLTVADSAMEKWMHDFDPDHAGKSHDETMTYMTKQKAEIAAIDSQLDIAISESGKYLKNIKVK